VRLCSVYTYSRARRLDDTGTVGGRHHDVVMVSWSTISSFCRWPQKFCITTYASRASFDRNILTLGFLIPIRQFENDPPFFVFLRHRAPGTGNRRKATMMAHKPKHTQQRQQRQQTTHILTKRYDRDRDRATIYYTVLPYAPFLSLNSSQHAEQTRKRTQSAPT
jgi:hypothetical protein